MRFCAAQYDGTVIYLIDVADLDRFEADMTAENLVVVSCPEHDRDDSDDTYTDAEIAIRNQEAQR